MYSKRDTYIKIDEKSAPKSHSVVIVGSNHLGEAKTDITMITQWKDANDGTWQSLRTPFDNIADALYYTRKYCNMLARAANEPCLPFCAEIAGLDANGLRDEIVTYVLSECTANELPWRVRVYENDEPRKAFADFYSLNDAVDYIAEQNNLRVSPDLAMVVSKKNGYTLQAIESQDEDIAAKSITIAEDFDEKDADGKFIRRIKNVDAISEIPPVAFGKQRPAVCSVTTASTSLLTPYNLADYLQNLITSTETEWDITNAEYEFRDYELTVWLHVDVMSSKNGKTERVNAHFGLDDPSCNHIFFEPLGYKAEEYASFEAIGAILPEIQDKLLHSSAVFEYLKNDLLDRNPFINAASLEKLYECDPSRRLYPDGVIPEKEQAKPKKRTADIDR